MSNLPKIPIVPLTPCLEMPIFGLGTSRNVSSEEIYVALDAALAAGYRLFDTAIHYGNEPQLGKALHSLLPKYGLGREDIWLTSKVKFGLLGADVVRRCISCSLASFRTDYLDLYLIHYPADHRSSDPSPDEETLRQRRQETWMEMEALKREGLVRAIGVSNYEIHHLEELKSYATIWPAVNQSELHPHLVRPELRDYCRMNRILFQGYSSMAKNSRAMTEEPVLVEIAAAHATTAQLVLLAWSLNQNVAIIPKSSNPGRIRENLTAIDLRLTPAEIQRLSALDRHQNYANCTPWNVP